jgi:hypothetical protein
MPTIEKLSADKQIETFYVAYYGSAAGSAGFAKWEADYAKLLDHNTPKSALEMLGDYIGYSKETKALYPFLAHLPFNVHSALVRAEATTLIDNIYQNLLGHAPPAGDPALAKLLNGFLHETTTISEVVLTIANSATGADRAALENKLTVATDFTTASTAAGLGFTSPPPAGYLAEAAAVVAATTGDPSTVTTQEAAITAYIAQASAVTYTLTTGADDFVGKPGVDSTFIGDLTSFMVNGKGPTLNSDDILTGGTGAGVVNTLIINDSNPTGLDVIPAGAQISNMQDILLQTAGNAGGGSAFDTTGISGVVEVTVNSAGDGLDVVKAAAGVAITIDHTASTGGVTTIGGGAVSVTSAGGDYSGDTGILVGSGVNASYNPTGAVDVTATSAAASVWVFGGTDVTIDTAAKNYAGSHGDYYNYTQVGANYATPSPSEPTGNVTVDDTGDAAIYVYGGLNVNVQSAGGFVQVGSDPDSSYTDALSDTVGSSSGAVYAPAGTVTITDTAAQVWSETTGYEEDVEVIGGTNVSVTTNTGAVNIGDDALNTAGTALLAGQNPSGNVTVVDTASNKLSDVYVAGGVNVGVTTSGGSVYVGDVNTDNSTGGAGLNDVVSAVTGAVTIVDHAVATWTNTTGSEQEIDVIGGTTVNVTTNTASVYVGGFANDMTADDTAVPAINSAGTAFLAGQEPTGNVTVADTATAEGNGGAQIDVFGGANVTVTASGADVTIGADVSAGDDVSNVGSCSGEITAANDIVSAPTGAVTVTNTAAAVFDGIINGDNASVHIIGGTTVGVTTNSGNVFIGSSTGDAGSEASGNVTVTDTATSPDTEVGVYGGANVNISSSAGLIGVGGSSAATNPTGSVTINQSGVNTGYQYDNFIVVGGAGQGDSVTINTTGAGWRVDAPGPEAGILVGGNTLDDDTPVTGAVLINDMYSGWQHDNIAVYGGTTVTINDTVSSENFIDVGAAPILTNGMTLANGADDATGNVVINDSSTFGSTTYYGSENFDVVTNGSTSVSVTGGDGCNSITDADTALQTAGIDAGRPVGASHLSSVSLDGVGGVTTITSDALTTLSIDNADCLTVDVVNNTVNSSLTINLASDTHAAVEDESVSGYIGSITVTATGAASDLLLDTPDATSVTFDNTAALTLDDCSDLADVVTIMATGSGELTLGNLVDLSKLTSINASGASGGVQVQIDDGTTSFTGGSGNDVVSITSNTLGAGVTLSGGGGVNTLYADYAASVDDNPLGNLIGVSGFQNLGVVGYADGTYSAEGFQGLIVGAYNPYAQGYQGVDGNIAFTDVAQGATLDLIDPSGACSVSYVLQNAYTSGGALSITDGVDTANGVTGTLGSSVAVDAACAAGAVPSGITTLNIDSQGAGCVNMLEVDAPTVTKINITGDEALTLATDSTVSVINASGSSSTIDVTGVELSAAGVTVTGGSGLIVASGYAATDITSSVDVFNVGSGGGVITLGAGGAGFYAGDGTSTGSETVNLSSTAPVGTTIVACADVATIGIEPQDYGSFGVVNGWTHGTIASGQTADSIVLSGTPLVIGNQSNIHEMDGAYYNVSDGVISLASGSAIPSATQQLQDAEAIVDLGGVGSVGMITVNVQTAPDVTSSATFVIQDNGVGPSVADTFVELAGISGATGFGGVLEAEDPAFAGNVGAGTSIMLGGFSGYDTAFARVTLDNAGSATADETYIDTGYTIDSLANSGAGFTNTYSNLANFGILQADTTGDGNVVVTQVGVDPILTFTAFGAVDVNDLTYGNSAIANDDPLLTLYSDLGSINITGDLIDASNTGTTLVISGGSEVTVNGVIDTALTTINASTLEASLTLTASQNGLSIVGATADGDAIVASGAHDSISVGSDTGPASTCAYVEITANGAGDTISVVGGEFDGTPADGINAGGVGDTITEAGACGVVEISSNGAALGANDTINVGDASVGHGDAYVIVGANSIVNIVGSCSSAEVNVENVATGAQSSGSYAFTTISGVHGCDLTLDIGNTSLSVNSWAGGSNAWDGFKSQVNVATATSLANAIDIAAKQAAVLDQQFNGGVHSSVVNGVLELNAKTGLADWFQYGGNTYIVEAVNTGSTSATHAALGVHDEVIKLTGLVDANHVQMDFAGAV